VRIVAGTFRGRHLAGPGKAALRPTSDRLRETLFNVLGDTVRDAVVLDAFAGTGAVGLEALSRGARRVTFVEHDRQALRALDANIAALGVADACAVVRADFLGRSRGSRGAAPVPGGPFDLMFLDPPYDLDGLDAALDRAASAAAPGARIVLEHATRRAAPGTAGDRFRRFRLLEAGDSALSFYSAV
jgi:16S rRNA (guanine(966)-N(2))-methyltransferase RsmD